MQLDLAPQSIPLAYDAQGNVRVGGTRVTLDAIVARFKQDRSPEEIAFSFPTVGLSNIYAAIAYFLAHPAEVEAYLEQQQHEAEAIRKRIEALQGTQGWYERLLEEQTEVDRAQ